MRTSSTPICCATHLVSQPKSNVVLLGITYSCWGAALWSRGSSAFCQCASVPLIERVIESARAKEKQVGRNAHPTCYNVLVTPGGFEPSTPGLGNLCSIP